LSNHTTFAMRESAGLALSGTPQPVPKLAVLVRLGRGTPPPFPTTVGAAEVELLVPLTRPTRMVEA
jgi:hypothetical protein